MSRSIFLGGGGYDKPGLGENSSMLTWQARQAKTAKSAVRLTTSWVTAEIFSPDKFLTSS